MANAPVPVLVHTEAGSVEPATIRSSTQRDSVLCTFADGTTCWMPTWRVDVQPQRQWTFGDLQGTRAAAHQHLALSPEAPDQAIVALPGGFTLYPAAAALATWPLLVVEVIAR